MGWLDDLLGPQLQQDGVNIPQRKVHNLIGVTATDNPSTGATDIRINGGAGFGSAKLAVSAKSNGGVTSYPVAAAQAVGISTFVRVAIADHDSIRLPVDADAILTLWDGIQGRLTNSTAFIVDVYPPAGVALGVNGVALAIDTPVELPPGATMFWMLDSDGTFYLA